jgi:hypothetical protein
MLIPALISFDTITRAELNDCLVACEHKMGAWNRPPFREWLFGLRHHGRVIAATASGDLIKEPVAGFTRAEAFELGRVCAEGPNLNRAVLRLWREFVFPVLCNAHGFTWVVSYQDAVLHNGDLYRFDGWVRLCRSRSGTDGRSGAIGRDKWIWGWCADPALRAARRAQSISNSSVRAAA